MIIIAHWDVPAVFNGHQSKKLFTRWSHTAKAFGVTDLRFVEVDPMPEFGDAEINLTKYKTLNDAIKGLKNLVYVEQGGQHLESFKFPKDPTLVFGGDYGELPKADVSIDTAIPLHADITLGIVLNTWRSQ